MAGSDAAWAGHTNMHPLGLAGVVACGIALLYVPRRFAVIPFIVLACLISSGQRVVIAGCDFSLLRLLVLFGTVRVAMRGEAAGVRLHLMDYLLIAFALTRAAIYTLQQGSPAAIVNQLGQGYDSVGMYLLLRCLVRSRADIIGATLGFAWLAGPVLLAFMVEKATGRNLFAIFGGVPEITLVREGRLRCQGAFAHPILAGCFWANLAPLFLTIALIRRGAERLLAAVGLGCGLSIIVLCSSSTPLAGLLFACLGATMFLLRRNMGAVLAVTVALLVALHMSMQKPVWHLVSRISLTQGNTGWHRYMLIDSAIHRFNEWWLLGTTSTAHWFDGGQDVTNQFILEGVRGGFVTLVIFVAVIWTAFRTIGRAWRANSADKQFVVLCWCLGVTLFVHCTNFLAVSYFGQITFEWFLHLAMIGTLREQLLSVGRTSSVSAISTTAAGAPLSARPVTAA